ncbi:MAG: AAA family ATPase [Parcubacteria group bacterium]|nr:AAA family ATPase [Parcubacteria group bacterium]
MTRELAVLEEAERTHPTAVRAEKLIRTTRNLIALLSELEKAETLEAFKNLKPRVKKIRAELEAILNEKQPAAGRASEKITDLGKKIATLKQELQQAEYDVAEKQNLVDKLRRAESKATTNVFETQREYQELQLKLNQTVAEGNQIDVALAKTETHKQDVALELEREVPSALHEAIKNYHPSPRAEERVSWERIAAIKQDVEMIGGTEPHVEEEYREAKKRHDFLEEQLADLRSALEKTKRALAELDGTIEKQFNRAFEKIEQGFVEYFKTLFDGGTASLVRYKQSELETLNEDVVAGLSKKEQETLAKATKTGIEIKASPPGKKVTSISMLSGGERALTSIALICAIIRANPAPFVVLDEVDAALDEANSERFAQILEKLSHQTQFITITHNRTTMEQASVLYGVTMGENGVSKLLSVDLEKAVASIA